MTIEEQLRHLREDARPTPEQEHRLFTTAVTDARRSLRRRRVRRIVFVPLGVAAGITAAVLAITSLQSNSHAARRDTPAVISVSPGPTAVPTPTLSPLPPLGYQTIPGVDAARAATIVSRCVSWNAGPSAYIDADRAVLDDWVPNSGGSVAIVTGPIRSDAKPPPGYTPTPTRTLFVECWLLPDDTVDTESYGQIQYADHALPGPVLVESSGGGVTHTAYSKATGARTPWLSVMAGRVARNVARIDWTAPDGQFIQAMIRNGFFLANTLDSSAPNGPGSLRAYDAEGDEIAIPHLAPSNEPAQVYWP